MSFLTDNFSSEMRSLTIVRNVKTKNSIGETIDTPETPRCFSGIILMKKQGFDKLLDWQVPQNISSHVLYAELWVDITRDDTIIDNGKRFMVKSVSVQVDFWGKDDHQIISIDHIE